jgi:hypothetical protein
MKPHHWNFFMCILYMHMIGDKLLDHQVGVVAAALKQDQRLHTLHLGRQ